MFLIFSCAFFFCLFIYLYFFLSLFKPVLLFLFYFFFLQPSICPLLRLHSPPSSSFRYGPSSSSFFFNLLFSFFIFSVVFFSRLYIFFIPLLFLYYTSSAPIYYYSSHTSCGLKIHLLLLSSPSCDDATVLLHLSFLVLFLLITETSTAYTCNRVPRTTSQCSTDC